MGFFGEIISSAVKTALIPVAIVKDVVNVATDQDADATRELVENAVKDAGNALSDLADGEL